MHDQSGVSPERGEAVCNTVDGDATAPVVQAGAVHGDITVNHAPPRVLLDLDVQLDSPTIESAPRWWEYKERWIETERQRLMGQAEGYDWSSNNKPAALGPEPFKDTVFYDRRSPEKYAAQVDIYLQQVERVMTDRLLMRLEQHAPVTITPQIKNCSDRFVSGIELDLWFGRGVRGFTDDMCGDLPAEFPSLPEPPIALGASGVGFEFFVEMDGGPQFRPGQVSQSRFLMNLMRRTHHRPDVSWTAEQVDENNLRVRFDEFDLRAGACRRLPLVPLRVFLPPGRELVCRWSATSINVDGKVDGNVRLSTVESTFELSQISVQMPKRKVQSVLEFTTKSRGEPDDLDEAGAPVFQFTTGGPGVPMVIVDDAGTSWEVQIE